MNRAISSKKKIAVPTKDGTVVMLTQQQKDYADLKKQQAGKRSLVSIAAEAYPNATGDTLRQIVNANEKNKDIALYNDEQVNQAKTYISQVVSDPEVKTRDRLTAAFDVLDRTTGKAIQRTEVRTTSLQIGIDLSGMAATDGNVVH